MEKLLFMISKAIIQSPYVEQNRECLCRLHSDLAAILHGNNTICSDSDWWFWERKEKAVKLCVANAMFTLIFLFRNYKYVEGKTIRYRVFLKYCVFSLKCCDFSELCQFCCSAGVLHTCLVCVHTLTPRENRERPRVRNVLESSENI